MIFLLAVLAATTKSTSALAEGTSDTTKACVQAYGSAQERRKSDDLLAAREALRTCSNRICPAIVQSDCTTWLDEVVEELPSIVLQAKVDDSDVFDVSVSMDGVRLAAELNGRPIEINPGLHTFVFERGGNSPIQKKIIIPAHQRSQLVSVDWKKRATALNAPIATPTNDDGPTTARPIPVPVYVLGGTAVVGFTTFAVLGLSGRSTQRDLETSCSPHCVPSDVDALQTRYLVANLSAVVGGLAAASALVIYLTRPTHETVPRVSFDIHAASGGAAASLRTSF